MTQLDTLFIRNSLVLEAIKEEFENSETNITTGVSKTTSTGRKIGWYCITDVSKMIGMSFNVKKAPTRNNIKTYTGKSKSFGYGMTEEPFLAKDGYRIADFHKLKDTVFNGQKCFVVLADRKATVNNNGMIDELLFTRIVINPSLKEYHYPFISDALAKHFGGAIMLIQSKYKSGVDLSMKLSYEKNIPSKYISIFDKYQAYYFSNISLLDRLKN